MNKSELIASVAEASGLAKKDAEKAVNAVCANIVNALDNVQIIGFGTFEVKQREARQGRNPQTGETINIPACKAVTFKAGKPLKEAVNQ